MSFASLADHWWSWFAPVSVQLVPLGIAIAVIDRLWLRKLRVEWRASIWSLLFLKLVLPPDFQNPLALVGLLPKPVAEVYSGREFVVGEGAGWRTPLFALWMTGFLAILALQCWRLRRHLREFSASGQATRSTRQLAERIATRLGLRELPPLHVSPTASGAYVAGIARPRVVLPSRLEASGHESELEHVLAHELSHVRRADPLKEFGLFVLHAAFWFHPVLWLAHRELDLLREQSCDLAAARVTGSAQSYRRTLLTLASRMESLSPSTGLGFVSGSRILSRLQNLEQVGTRLRAPSQLQCWLLTGFLGASCLPMTHEELPGPLSSRAELEELPGCMQARFLVMRELAQQSTNSVD